MELNTEQIRKAVNDAFDDNMIEVDNWNDAVFYNSKEKFITDVVKKLTIPVVGVPKAEQLCDHNWTPLDQVADICTKFGELDVDY